MCGCDSYDGPSVYHQALVKARLERKCYECGSVIVAGQRYSRAKGCWDGEWNTYCECMKCFALRQAWRDTEGCWPSHGNLRDDVLECLRGETRGEWEERQGAWEEGSDEDVPSRPAPSLNLKFGMAYRRCLGRMGPRRAA